LVTLVAGKGRRERPVDDLAPVAHDGDGHGSRGCGHGQRRDRRSASRHEREERDDPDERRERAAA
jgi:hypothetical protein